jgi:Cu/Ag efflux pump CusA
MKALGNGGEKGIFPVTGAVDVNAFGGLINQWAALNDPAKLKFFGIKHKRSLESI